MKLSASNLALALAADAEAYAGDGFTARLRDLGVTDLAGLQALAAGGVATDAIEGLLDLAVDLVLYLPVFRPADGHHGAPCSIDPG